MIRVTDRMASIIAEQQLQRRSAALLAKQREATTGLKLQHAADDPVGAALLERIEDARGALQQHQRNIERANEQLAAADTVLGSAMDAIQRSRELAIAMANGTVNAEEREQAAIEIEGLRASLLAMANSRHGQSYLFAGDLTDVAPFADDGSYRGDTAVRQVQIGQGRTVDVGVDGEEAFGTVGADDAFATIDALVAALRSNDQSSTAAGAVVLSTVFDRLASARSTVGRQMAELLTQADVLSSREMQLDQQRSAIVDAEGTDVLAELAQAQQALTSTVEVTARMLNTLNLVDRL